MARGNRPGPPLLGSSGNTGAGIYVKRETMIVISENTAPVLSLPGQHGNIYDGGSSSPITAVMPGPQVTISSNTFHNTITSDPHIHHLCRPKAFRKLSNSSSLLSEIFRHPEASEDLLRKKIKRANDRDTGRDLLDFLRNKTPSPENYMSGSEQLKGGDPPAKKKKGVLSFLGRKLRKGKRAAQTSSASSPSPAPLRLPDSAVAGRTTGGHRHIAISIPLEYAYVDGVVGGPKPPTEPSSTSQPPQPEDTDKGPVTIRRKPLSKSQTPPVVGLRSSSKAAASIRVIPPSPDTPPPSVPDPDETMAEPSTSALGTVARKHSESEDGGTRYSLEAVGGRSLVGSSHHELTAPRVAVPGVVVPLSGVFLPPRPLHRSPPLRLAWPVSNDGSDDTIPESVTSGVSTSSSEVDSDVSSVGATVGASVIPSLGSPFRRLGETKKGQQNTIRSTPVVQPPTPPGEQEETFSEADADENDRFVTAQPSPDNNHSPWTPPFEEGTFIDVPPCGSSTPKLRSVPSHPSGVIPTSHDSSVPERERKEGRRIPRSESHLQLMEKYQRLQMLRARDLEMLLGRLEALEGRQGGARRGHVNVHALDRNHFTTTDHSTSHMAVLYEHDNAYNDDDASSPHRIPRDAYPPSPAFSESPSGDEYDTSTLPENLYSDYEESCPSSSPSNPYDDDNIFPSPTPLTSPDHHPRNTTTTPEYPPVSAARDPLPSRRGFPHPPTLFPAHNTMYSAPLPSPRVVRLEDSFDSFLDRVEKARRKGMETEAQRRGQRPVGAMYELLGVGDDGDGGGARRDGMETVEPVMRWLVESTCSRGEGGEGECEIF